MTNFAHKMFPVHPAGGARVAHNYFLCVRLSNPWRTESDWPVLYGSLYYFAFRRGFLSKTLANDL